MKHPCQFCGVVHTDATPKAAAHAILARSLDPNTMDGIVDSVSDFIAQDMARNVLQAEDAVGREVAAHGSVLILRELASAIGSVFARAVEYKLAEAIKKKPAPPARSAPPAMSTETIGQGNPAVDRWN